MKNIFTFCFFFSFFAAAFSQTALLYNKGGSIYVTKGGYMIAQNLGQTASVYNETGGTVNNQGTIVVQGNIQNDAAIIGNGDTIKLTDDWINNNSYTGNNSLVEMAGGAEKITGTAVTTFDNLTLDGSGVAKTQTIDAITAGNLSIGSAELATDSFRMLVTNSLTNAVTYNLGTGFASSVGPGTLSWITTSSNTYVFPTGSPSSQGASIFRPIEFNPAGFGPDTFGVCLVKGNATADGYNVNSVDTVLCLVNPHFYHRLYRTGPDATALSMYYDPSNDGNWTDQAHWKNNIWNYTGPSAIASALGLTSVTMGGVNDFTPEPFALAVKKFKLSAGPDVTIADGSSTQFVSTTTASGAPTIDWTPSQALSCTNCLDPVANPNTTTQYRITVTDASGCTVLDSLIVTVVGSDLLLPTGFSPNGDGVNDFFRILNKNIGKFTLQVYDRWGNLVYENTDPTVGWDGTYKNQKADMGVYVWECTYSIEGDPTTKFAKGNVTLIR
jgi:gliding motility-associated-like protein